MNRSRINIGGDRIMTDLLEASPNSEQSSMAIALNAGTIDSSGILEEPQNFRECLRLGGNDAGSIDIVHIEPVAMVDPGKGSTIKDKLFLNDVWGLHDVCVGLKYYVREVDKLASMVDNLALEDDKRSVSVFNKLLEANTDFYDDYIKGKEDRDVADLNNRFDASFKEAEILLRNLPRNIPIPVVVVERNGEIGLEWRKGDKGFLISFEGEGVITFAGYFGKDNEIFGLREIKRSLNQFLLGHINELYSTNS